jgi:hypothetical protein
MASVDKTTDERRFGKVLAQTVVHGLFEILHPYLLDQRNTSVGIACILAENRTLHNELPGGVTVTSEYEQ